MAIKTVIAHCFTKEVDSAGEEGSNFITLFNARRFYSSKGDPLGTKGLSYCSKNLRNKVVSVLHHIRSCLKITVL